MEQVAEATDPILKQRPSETARLAVDLAKLEEKLTKEQPAARPLLRVMQTFQRQSTTLASSDTANNLEKRL